MIRVLLLLFAVLFTILSFAVEPDELPFGAYDYDTMTGYSFSEQLRDMRDSLGFNIFWDGSDIPDIQEMGNSGITVIYADKYLVGLSNFNYAKIQAEERQSYIRMYCCGDDNIDTSGNPGFWYSENGSADKLFGPNSPHPPCKPSDYVYNYIKMERKYPSSADTSIAGEVINYRLDIRAKINDRQGNNDIVAYLKVIPQKWDVELIDTSIVFEIYDSAFDGSDIWTIIKDFNFNLPPTDNYRFINKDTSYVREDKLTNMGVAFSIETTGKREVSIDWLKISDQGGRRLVEDDYYSEIIKDYVEDYTDYGNTLWGWYFRDEPYWINLPCEGAILNTARVKGRSDWGAMSLIHITKFYQYWFDYVEMDVLFPDIYPYTCKSESPSNLVKFTGYKPVRRDRNSLNMQNRLEYYAEKCSTASKISSDNGSEFWLTPQCFEGRESSGLFWRKPTRAELACQTWMGLTYGAKGIIYWLYGGTGKVGSYRYFEGMFDVEDRKTDLWYEIKERINPYIKAIDSLYLGLDWDNAYALAPGDSGDWVSRIGTSMNSPESNPDLGWFHVGQFYDNAGDKYVMIVNRACSRDSLGNEAPEITAFVRLNYDAVGSVFARIIDIAKGTNANDWVGHPATTFTAVLADGTIPFRATLKAGEGRLYKIVPWEF